MPEREPQLGLLNTFRKEVRTSILLRRVAASAIVAVISTIAAWEFPSLEIPRAVAPVIGFGGTMIISATVQSAITVVNLLRNK